MHCPFRAIDFDRIRTDHPMKQQLVTRRRAMAAVIAGVGSAALTGQTTPGQEESELILADNVSVLAPIVPDPSPPGVINELLPGLELWEARNRASVRFETAAVELMKAKILINIRRGYHVHDVMYCAGWSQELAGYLIPIDTLLGATTRNDIPAWSLNSFRWNGKTYGVPSVANPMILFGNRDAMDRAGISELPENWDDLVEAARLIHQTGTAGWTMAGGQLTGLGGLATSWQLFFLQAGGELFDIDDRPLFANDSGVAAIEMLQRLLPYSDASVLEHGSMLEATVPMLRGEVGMMANWAVMRRSMVNPEISQITDSVVTAALPAGPVGTASVDSGDGWTIESRTWIPGKSMSLIRFFLEPRAQKQMFAQTGWLPISLTALDDPEFQLVAPHAVAVREQLRHRIDSGFRPNYDVVTTIIGTAVRSALIGEATPISALRAARDQLIQTRR